MNPTRVSGAGYGRFDSFEVDIPAGTTAVIGPNGAGKSRLLNAIELALFADGSRDLSPWLAPGHDRLLLELVFEHAGETYRVRRTFTDGARGKSTLDLEVVDESTRDQVGRADWVPLTRQTADETQQEINRILGLSRATFNASAFLAQGNSAAFPEAKPADRKRLLGEILDPNGRWTACADRAGADAKTVDVELVKASVAIADREQRAAGKADIEADISRLVTVQTEAQTGLEAAEKRTLEAQQAVVENAAHAERIRSLTQAHEHAKTTRDRAASELQQARDAATSLAAAESDIARLEQLAATVPELERHVEEQQAARTARQAAEHHKQQADGSAATARSEEQRLARELNSHRAQRGAKAAEWVRLEESHEDTEKCSRCEQTLGKEARAASVRTLREELAELDSHIANLDLQREGALVTAQMAQQNADAIVLPEVPASDFTAGLASARRAAEELAAKRGVVDRWRDAAAAVPELEQTHTAAVAALSAAAAEIASATEGGRDETELTVAVTEARAAVATARSRLDTVTHDLVRARGRLDQVNEAKLELDALQRERKRLGARVGVLKDAEQMFGRDGIPVLIVENDAIPQIELEANRILEAMPTAKGETMRVELRTQREQKSVEHLKETLDILVTDSLSTREHATFSGGERERLNLALRIALARLLAHRRDAESRVLVIDEPDALDELGQGQLVGVLASVAGDYDRILLASHAVTLRDSFEQVIEVRSDDRGMSFVAGAPVLEAVTV